MMADYELSQVPLDLMRPDPANPRRMSEEELEALTRSIREFGFVEPVVARREDMTVIGGHQRLIAARRLGLETVPAVLVDLSEDQARLLNLALNRISGDWDEELLARLLTDLSAIDELDLSLSGFADDELAKLLRSLDARERRERVESFDLDIAFEDADQVEPQTAHGDLWLLGEHRLLCGDSTDNAVLARLTAGTRTAMAFTDPPYNVAYGDHGGAQPGAKRRRIANDSMSTDEWGEFCRAWASQLVEHVDGALYVTMSTREWPSMSIALADVGAHWSDTIIWAKDRFTLGSADYQRQYEPVWYGWPEGTKHHWCGDRDQGDVWQIPRPSSSPLHPTTKPLELVERAIENSSEPADAVLDLFLGSGTTLIAAERTGRHCWGAELEPKYVDIAVARWEHFTGEQAIKEKAE